MDDQTANSIKARLDQDLQSLDPNNAIAFGQELFNAFKDRGWLDLKKFGVLGSNFLAMKHPAYGTHYAFVNWEVPDSDYKLK